MNHYVFSIGIIPVQEFISEARRSRDLRVGSAILSFITAQILGELKKTLKAKIIIPDLWSFEEILNNNFEQVIANQKYSIPNKASGYCSAKNDENLKKQFKKIEKKHLYDFWISLLKKYYKQNNFCNDEEEVINGKLKEYFDYLNYKKMQSPFQLIWVAILIDSTFEKRTNEQKQQDLKDVGEYFDDTKNTRPIKPWLTGAPIGKCTQCGKREGISPPNYDFKQWWKWYQSIASAIDIRKGYKFEESERLCSVCVLKRLLSYSVSEEMKSFPSTREIAARHWFNELSKTDIWKMAIKDKFDNCKQILNKQNEDEFLIFYSKDINKKINSLEDVKNNVNKYSVEKMKKFYKDIKRFNSEIIDTVKNNKTGVVRSKPSNYLSIITYDGDKMGEKVQKYWKTVPIRLFEFQNRIIELINIHSAEPFYTGGDEGLILCPIETTLKLALAIRKEFNDLFKDIDEQMTLSMGIIIFDKNRPMGAAIQQAQYMLKQAKAIDDNKNALAVGIQTASGKQWYFRDRWGKSWERINTILNTITNKTISRTWAYEVEQFLQKFSFDELWELKEPIQKEIKRITYRKINSNNDLREKKKFREFWETVLDGDTWLPDNGIVGIGNEWKNQFHLIGYLSKFIIES